MLLFTAAIALLAASVTDVTQLPAMPAPSLQAFIARQSPADKQAILTEMGKHRIALQFSDAQIAALYNGAGADILLKTTRAFLSANPTYETVLVKQERMGGKLNEIPDRMFIRFREQPLAIYIKWLKGGRHVGQEVMYDGQRDPKHLHAHGGGWLNIVTLKLALDSKTVHLETKHDLTELGFGTLIDRLEADRARIAADGLSTAPVIARSVVYKGKRYWENVYEMPGPPRYYAARARFLFDLETGMPMLMEFSDKAGVLQERMEYESVKWLRLEAEHFDTENADYRF